MKTYDSVEEDQLVPSNDVFRGSKDGVFRNVFRRSKLLSRMKKRRMQRQRMNQYYKHSWIYTMLNSKSRAIQAVIFKNMMSVIILIDLIFFVFSTEPRFRECKIFYIEEGVASLIFLFEYIARIITIVEHKKYGRLGPIKGRFMYMLTFHSLIDALATFPFFLEFVIHLNLPHLTYLRFFRLMRILRTESLGKAMDSLQRVLFYNREILYVAGVMAAGLIMFTAVLMYYLRPQDMNDDEWSISTTIYYSTLMLTGQGGPDGDLPWYTQMVVLLTGLFSIGMFAIPASMLTWGFEAEAQRVASKTRRRYLRKLSGGVNFSSSSSSSSSEDFDSHSASSSDEEYFKLIAGENEDSGKGDHFEQQKKTEESFRKLRELIIMFQNADSDGSGSLSKEEFLRMVYPILLPNGKYDTRSSISDEIDRTTSLTVLVKKVNNLEARIEETNSKLDRVLDLMNRHE